MLKRSNFDAFKTPIPYLVRGCRRLGLNLRSLALLIGRSQRPTQFLGSFEVQTLLSTQTNELLNSFYLMNPLLNAFPTEINNF